MYIKYDGKTIKKVRRLVKVVDEEKPILNIEGEKEITIDYEGEYKELGYKCNDNYDGDITDKVIVNNDINTKVLGEYEVTYIAKDTSSNESKEVRKVFVKDLTAPKIEINRNKNSYLIKGQSIDINNIKAIDNYDGDVTNKVKIEGSIDTNTIGLYGIKYIVEDSSSNETILNTTINVQNKNTKGIPVLMYHWFYDESKETYGNNNNHNYISKSEFTKQIKYLKDNNFYFPTWEELESYIDSKIDLPEKSIILTDDDGNESFFRIALPICEEYKIPITSFVVTDRAGWRDYENSEYVDFESHSNSLHMRSCKGSWDGAAMCATYDFVSNDTKLSIEATGHNNAYAYPFGHYNDNLIKALKENGIKMAFTINNGRVKKGSNKYKLPRVRISRTTTLNDYIKLVK